MVPRKFFHFFKSPVGLRNKQLPALVSSMHTQTAPAPQRFFFEAANQNMQPSLPRSIGSIPNLEVINQMAARIPQSEQLLDKLSNTHLGWLQHKLNTEPTIAGVLLGFGIGVFTFWYLVRRKKIKPV